MILLSDTTMLSLFGALLSTLLVFPCFQLTRLQTESMPIYRTRFVPTSPLQYISLVKARTL